MISVITWDASFRESFHTIEYFLKQRHQELEFIWVDYYKASKKAVNLCKERPGFQAISLGSDPKSKWHLGKCINEGVRVSSGNILIIPDGDVVAGPDFVSVCENEIEKLDQMAVYFRRYDETDPPKWRRKRDIEFLENNTKLLNPTNYAGCLTLRRNFFDRLNGYETHDAFSGPGINGMEFYTRIRNAGAHIRWSDEKIYHPWHKGSGTSGVEAAKQELVKSASSTFPWIMPYAGVDQSWIVRQRELNLSVEASREECDQLLGNLPQALRPLSNYYG